jgi:hypothetical protein
MSYTMAMIAARAAPDAFKAAVLKAWSFAELGEPTEHADYGAFCEWLAANDSEDVQAKGIYRDGEWSVLFDYSMLMSSDEPSLAELSRALGLVMVNNTQGTAGFAEFRLYEAGALRRRILSDDGALTQTGAPLPEEAGLDLDDFYMGSHEELSARVGVPSFWGVAQPPFSAFRVYGSKQPPDASVLARPAVDSATRAVQARRPWWKFW